MRKTMIAIAAVAALGAASLSGAVAAPHGHFGHGGFAFHGRGFHGGFFGPGIGLYDYGGGCWVRSRVWTPFGWRWRLVDVC